MHLGTVARQFKAQLDDPQYASMSFEDRLVLLVDAEWDARKGNHLLRFIRNAGFSIPGASLSVEGVYLPDRHLNRGQILHLASCSYIQDVHHVILLMELSFTRSEGTYREYIKKLRKVRLLILDE